VNTIAPTTCYQRGCGHPEHRLARNDYTNHRRREIAYGRWQPYVDAEPARAHALRLMEQGVPLSKIKSVYSETQSLVYGRPSRGISPSRRVRAETAEAILAIRPTLEWLGPRAEVDPAPASRRLQALYALGWGWAAIARRMGAAEVQVRQSLSAVTVTAGWMRRVMAVYDELSMTRPEGQYADRTRSLAEVKGFLPPLAWDDDLLDLSDADLEAELARRVAAMDLAELARCYRAHHEWGDRSPLIVAGAKAFPRRRREARRERDQQAA
jgi:hypothetical protein